MNELGCQKLIVDAVNRAGGFAFKMSHRFLVGVPDLLVKLPRHPAAILEAKLHRGGGESFKLGVTPAQRRFLRDAKAAGIRTGVASFYLPKPRLGIRNLSLALFALANYEAAGYTAHAADHVYVGNHEGRARTLLHLIEQFCAGGE